MKKGKAFWLIILLLFVLIQFFPVNKPERIPENENDLIENNQIPGPVSALLKVSCYDCHSNESKYPWYSYIAPVSWLVAKDIREGREELNFSEWEGLSKRDKAKLLDNMVDEVSDGEMPMPVYTLIHTEAKLDENQKKTLVDWAENFAERLFE